MNMDNIGEALMLIYDTLKDNPGATFLLNKIDEGDDDETIVEGIKEAVIMLEESHPSIAQLVKEKTRGYAYR